MSDIPYRLKCPFAKPEGMCDYWHSIVKCIGCRFANHPERARKEIDDLKKWALKKNMMRIRED